MRVIIETTMFLLKSVNTLGNTKCRAPQNIRTPMKIMIGKISIMNALYSGVLGKNKVMFAFEANQSYDINVSPLFPRRLIGVNKFVKISGNFILYDIVAVII